MELEADRHHTPLFLFLSRVLRIVVFSRRELLIVDPWSHEFTRMNLNVSSLPGAPLSMIRRQIFGVVLEEMQVNEINLR
jgi:hypothetical protein